jgi:hypothetical protein
MDLKWSISMITPLYKINQIRMHIQLIAVDTAIVIMELVYILVLKSTQIIAAKVCFASNRKESKNLNRTQITNCL